MATHSTARSKRPWHDDELTLLHATYPHHGARAIAPYLGRTEAAVEKKSFELEILPIRYTPPSPVVIEPLLCARLFTLQVGELHPLATRCDTQWLPIESYLLSLVFPTAGMTEMEVLFRRSAWEITEKAAQDGLNRASTNANTVQDGDAPDLRPHYVAEKGIDWGARMEEATQAALNDKAKALEHSAEQRPERPWLPYEDQKVIEYLNQHGAGDVSYARLAKDLNRTPEAIRYHCRKLIATGRITGSLPPFVLRKADTV